MEKRQRVDAKGVFDELRAQTDRGAAIIGAAFVDDILTELLQERLILSSRLTERLFSYEKNGPLSNFSSKIDIAYAVGAIPQNGRTDLHLIRRIRNRFAHHLGPLEFSDGEIATLCEGFQVAKAKDPRGKFIYVVTRLVVVLSLTTEVTPRLTTVGDEAGDKYQFAVDAIVRSNA